MASLLDKLDPVIDRYRAIEEMMADPEISASFERVQELARERASLEELVKIGTKVVRHGRDVTFQLAGVAIPRRLFAEFLRLIDGLRPKAAPT